MILPCVCKRGELRYIIKLLVRVLIALGLPKDSIVKFVNVEVIRNLKANDGKLDGLLYFALGMCTLKVFTRKVITPFTHTWIDEEDGSIVKKRTEETETTYTCSPFKNRRNEFIRRSGIMQMCITEADGGYNRFIRLLESGRDNRIEARMIIHVLQYKLLLLSQNNRS